MRRTMDAAPMRTISLSDIHPGLPVNVYARTDVALAIQITPPPPISGSLCVVSPAAVTIARDPASPDAAPQEQIIPLDFAKIDVFHHYFGAPSERAAFSELFAGQRIAITIEDNRAIAIAILHPAIYGQIAGISGNSIVVTTTGGSKVFYGPRQTVNLDPGKSKIFIGKLDQVVASPRGRPTTDRVSAFHGRRGAGSKPAPCTFARTVDRATAGNPGTPAFARQGIPHERRESSHNIPFSSGRRSRTAAVHRHRRGQGQAGRVALRSR